MYYLLSFPYLCSLFLKNTPLCLLLSKGKDFPWHVSLCKEKCNLASVSWTYYYNSPRTTQWSILCQIIPRELESACPHSEEIRPVSLVRITWFSPGVNTPTFWWENCSLQSRLLTTADAFLRASKRLRLSGTSKLRSDNATLGKYFQIVHRLCQYLPDV